MNQKACVLTIAGSDSGGGAGIQADLKAIAFLGAHGASALAAITAQNSRAVTDVFTLPDRIVEAQIDAVMEDLRPHVVKLGMLGNARMVELVARKLEQWAPREIVLDPVMIASSGARLLEESAIAAMRERLLPLATIVTPNWPEAEALAGRPARGLEQIRELAQAFRNLGASRVLFKGGHLPGVEVVDTLVDGERLVEYRHPRIQDAEGHGTGCALASALAAGLALGMELDEAVRVAADFVHQALLNRYRTGDSRPNYLGIIAEPPPRRDVT